MPRRSQQQTTGSRGEAFKALVVSSMGFIWNPVDEDNAVDGTIEIVDRDGVVTGNRILVQVKSTANGFKGGSDGEFVYGL